MTEVPWTPGPWTTNRNGEIRSEHGEEIAETRGRIALKPLQANALLIAAAPQMADLLADAEALISGELVGAEWKRACYVFVRRSRAALKAIGHPDYQHTEKE